MPNKRDVKCFSVLELQCCWRHVFKMLAQRLTVKTFFKQVCISVDAALDRADNLNTTFSELSLCFLIKPIIRNLNSVFDKTATANFVKSEFNIQLKGGSGEDECKVAAAIMFCFKRGCWNLGEHWDPFTASRHQRPV